MDERIMCGLFYGHRGAAGEAPENTLDGFHHARQLGVQAFELDVRLSVDGVPMVIHDEDLCRTTGRAITVSQHRATELARLSAFKQWPGWTGPALIPTLTQVLEDHADLPAFQIEIKTDGSQPLDLLCRQVITVIEEFDLLQRVVVTSFDSRALRHLRDQAPYIRRGFIARFDRPEHLQAALELECRNVCIPLLTSCPEAVRQAQAQDIHVTGWLGNTVESLKQLLAWQVDSITGDYPGLALPFLRERGYLE
ncbi:MAG: glycerophosphodiester phosphodiesterase [Chloroflexota bacterium]|nr:glycerophosphodiester phosphodiesterase [Chloroflexota bacterium]